VGVSFLFLCTGQTVREDSFHCVFFEFFASSCMPLFRSIGSGVFGGKRFADGPYLCVERSVSWRTIRKSLADSLSYQGASLVARLAFSDSLTRPCGQSAQALRTVRQYQADSPPGCLQLCSSGSILVLCFCFLIRGLSLGLVGLCVPSLKPLLCVRVIRVVIGA
jgi:hypothetical protein